MNAALAWRCECVKRKGACLNRMDRVEKLELLTGIASSNPKNFKSND
jgi:hypothetical protein